MRVSQFLRVAALGAGLALSALPAFAQGAVAPAAAPSPALVAIARDVVEASGAAASFDNIVPGFIDQAKAMIQQSNPDLGAQLKEIGGLLVPEFKPRTGDLVNFIAVAYASRFTEDELKKILAFYKSPEGQKLVKTMPLVLEESYGKSQEWGQLLSRDIVSRFRAELEKRGIKI